MNPPDSIEPDDASRPTGAEAVILLRAARSTEEDARFVGIWEADEIEPPHAGQKRAESGISAEQDGQKTTARF